jgi:hypothetical protein
MAQHAVDHTEAAGHDPRNAEPPFLAGAVSMRMSRHQGKIPAAGVDEVQRDRDGGVSLTIKSAVLSTTGRFSIAALWFRKLDDSD